MENNFYPLFINLKGKNVLIIGAGKVAYRKALNLSKEGVNLFIVTKDITEPRLKEIANIEVREFSPKDLDNKFLVIAATDDANFNDSIYLLCEERNILFNNSTSKDNMSFRFGSVIKNEEYTIGISGNGYPKKARELKDKLNSSFFQ